MYVPRCRAVKREGGSELHGKWELKSEGSAFPAWVKQINQNEKKHAESEVGEELKEEHDAPDSAASVPSAPSDVMKYTVSYK